jgi:hypothetical protein
MSGILMRKREFYNFLCRTSSAASGPPGKEEVRCAVDAAYVDRGAQLLQRFAVAARRCCCRCRY